MSSVSRDVEQWNLYTADGCTARLYLHSTSHIGNYFISNKTICTFSGILLLSVYSRTVVLNIDNIRII